jgi:hypothetical protein
MTDYPELQPNRVETKMDEFGEQQIEQLMAYCYNKMNVEDIAGLRLIISLMVGGKLPENPYADIETAYDSGRRQRLAQDIDTRVRIGTERGAMATWNALEAARRVVQPHVGDAVLACDSAASVYRLGLRQRGVSTAGVDPTAYAAMWDISLRGGLAPRSVAKDAAMARKYAAPHMKRAL